MPETWYVLESGRAVSPAEVQRGDDGRLIHVDGPVAMRGDVPMTRSVDPEAEAAKYATREAKPAEPARGYKTRGAKG